MLLVFNGLATFLYCATYNHLKLALLLHKTVLVNFPIATTVSIGPVMEKYFLVIKSIEKKNDVQFSSIEKSWKNEKSNNVQF